MLTIAHISDIHLSAAPQSTGRLRRVLDLLLTSGSPDAIIVTGDVADHGQAAEYDAFLAALPQGIPVLACPGNHDVPGTFARRLRPGRGSALGVLDLPGLRLVAVDSSVPGRDSGHLTAETVRVAAVACADSPRVILAMHHPPVPVGHPIADTMLLSNPDVLEKFLKDTPQVIAVLVGHVHTPFVSTFADRLVIGAPGVASALRLDPTARPIINDAAAPGLAIHTVGAHGLQRTTFHYAP